MTKLLHGDTVLVKHPTITDGKWKEGVVYQSNDSYEIRFSDGNRLITNRTDIIYDINIIKVHSYFNMACENCKHCEKYDFEDPCRKCFGSYSYWEPCDLLRLKNKRLDGLDINAFSIDEGPFITFTTDKKENKNMKKQQKRRNRNILVVKELNTAIEFDEIKFNGPATIIKWKPTFDQLAWDKKPDKTVTVAKEPDKFDKTTGFLLAVLKEILDNKSYGNILEKIDEIKEFDELSKQTVEADLNNKTRLHHCSIKDLKEQTEALENVYVPGSVVKYKYGKKYYMVCCYRFDDQLKEMVYVLRPYKGIRFTDNSLEHIYKRNIPHSKLIKVRRK